MKVTELLQYCIPALETVVGTTDLSEDILAVMDDQLGLQGKETSIHCLCHTEDTPDMTEELKRLLVMLAGPHGNTILKAYRVQRGLENGNE